MSEHHLAPKARFTKESGGEVAHDLLAREIRNVITAARDVEIDEPDVEVDEHAVDD